ncbi:hypothetical protein AVEN_46891-1 [Araneus ventricosus]|uniref:Uncharacterized protein n=1 Tax=Araneus ventricosus TaxID=182803 RepID=A0A4Y2CN53_ARAVE|nr:hypothetical protein AVEN_46891-1 [Araneus ventricosus]
MSIENSGQKDIVLQLMFTTTDAFNVNPSKGRVKGKDVQLFSVDRLSTDRELDLVVLFKEWNAEVPEEEVKCWHCSFEDETAQTHMVPVKIVFYRNRLEEMFCKFWKHYGSIDFDFVLLLIDLDGFAGLFFSLQGKRQRKDIKEGILAFV